MAVLFARADSIYKTIPCCDVYDITRDARTYPGGLPVIAHPPCRAWGRLRQFAKPRPDEKALALWAVDQVRQWGGVLEHPASSSLWPTVGLPTGKERDKWGGFTLSVDQFWWGHRAKKRTWLYICGPDLAEVPVIPLRFDAVTHTVGSMTTGRKSKKLPEITKAEREHTPPALAHWLVELALKCKITAHARV